jgi:hypothetical protein
MEPRFEQFIRERQGDREVLHYATILTSEQKGKEPRLLACSAGVWRRGCSGSLQPL